ncbi:MAG: GTPase HflX [Ruminococcaceae bacterium]|nr:GTPase HflX [Oscillospiraceae bacterium]
MEEKKDRVILIGASLGDKSLNDTDEASMKELAELVKTAEGEVVGEIIQNIKSIDPSTFIGSGKVEEIKEFIDANDITMAVFDSELSGSITRNLENALGVTVIDRSRLILDIFAMRAKSKEGKCQVELAQLKYLLPRLSGIGQSLSRLGGGIGTRGPGETKLESDRRHIQKKIEHLSDELSEIEKHRSNIRKKRTEDSIPVVALVGYTNVGKSSLLNLLSDSQDAYVENKLFATLDPLMRKITLEDKTEFIICDTVGFIRKLPHHLVEAFKSTLEEIKYANLIIHLADASNEELDKAMTVVNQIISDLNENNKPVLTVFNKCDIKEPPLYYQNMNTVNISVKEKKNISGLLDKIKEIIFSSKKKLKIILPFSQGGLLGLLYKTSTILYEESKEDGFHMEIVCDDEIYNKVRMYEVE